MKRVENVSLEVRQLVEEAREWGFATARRTKRFDSYDLACGCAIVSAYLFEQMTKRGYKNLTIILNYQHVFLLWHGWEGKSPLVIDPTASQIRGYDGALFATYDPSDTIPEQEWDWWLIESEIYSVSDLRRIQKDLDWPAEQMAMVRTGPRG